MTTAIVSHCSTNSFWQLLNIATEVCNILALQILMALKSLVEVCNVGGVMLAMVNFHGVAADMRLGERHGRMEGQGVQRTWISPSRF